VPEADAAANPLLIGQRNLAGGNETVLAGSVGKPGRSDLSLLRISAQGNGRALTVEGKARGLWATARGTAIHAVTGESGGTAVLASAGRGHAIRAEGRIFTTQARYLRFKEGEGQNEVRDEDFGVTGLVLATVQGTRSDIAVASAGFVAPNTIRVTLSDTAPSELLVGYLVLEGIPPEPVPA
jgi:hypothetical protein